MNVNCKDARNATVLLGPNEAVKDTAPVNVVSGDRPGRGVGQRNGALPGSGTSTRSVERGDGAVLVAHVAAIRTVRVKVLPRDFP